MREKEAVTSQLLGVLLFLSAAVDIAVRPFTAGSRAGAQVLIPAAAIDTALTVLLCIPLVRTVGSGGFSVLKSGVNAGSRVFLAAAAVLFTVGAAGAYLRMGEFVRYVSDGPIPQIVMIVVPALCVLYALRCGKAGLMRTFGIVNTVFLCSFALLLISNVQSMRFSHLSFEAFDPERILSASGAGFTLAPELVLFCFFASKNDTKAPKNLMRTLMLLSLFYMGVTFFTELVIGAKAQTQMQTVHTLSRLGSISVFRRMDALHSAVWVLAELCKISALCCGTAHALDALFGAEHSHRAQGASVVLLLLAAAFLSALPVRIVDPLLTLGTGAMIVYAVCACKIMEALHGKKEA